MRFNLRIDNETIGKMNYSIINSKTILLNYPCDDPQNCTFYIADIPRGKYLFEVWGAEGGKNGGKGGYSQGIIEFDDLSTQIFIYIGAKGPYIEGEEDITNFSYNGGGAGSCGGTGRSTGAGGGGTDIRIGGQSFNHRVIVAGGGGGGNLRDSDVYYGGDSGGLEGKAGTKEQGADAPGGTQTDPGKGEEKYGGGSPYKTHDGLFGLGGYGTSAGTCGGGGGGWFGGAGGAPSYHSGGGGGSGYVLTSFSKKPENYYHKDSTQYYFSKATLSSSDQAFPSPYISDYEIGHLGSGAIKITILNPYTQNYCNLLYLRFALCNLISIFCC